MYLDLRDLAEERKELTEKAASESTETLDEEDQDRLSALDELFSDLGGGHEDNTLIPESDWEEYCEEFAYDVGFVERDSQIASYVDWHRWADDAKSDYMSVDFDGETYWYR